MHSSAPTARALSICSNLLQVSKRVLVRVEVDGRRRAAEDALSAGILGCREAIYDLAAVVVDIPAVDNPAEVLLVADAKVEARADCKSGAGEGGDEKGGGELHHDDDSVFERKDWILCRMFDDKLLWLLDDESHGWDSSRLYTSNSPS